MSEQIECAKDDALASELITKAKAIETVIAVLNANIHLISFDTYDVLHDAMIERINAIKEVF